MPRKNWKKDILAGSDSCSGKITNTIRSFRSCAKSAATESDGPFAPKNKCVFFRDGLWNNSQSRLEKRRANRWTIRMEVVQIAQRNSPNSRIRWELTMAACSGELPAGAKKYGATPSEQKALNRKRSSAVETDITRWENQLLTPVTLNACQ